MNRPLKFRAWSDEFGSMSLPFGLADAGLYIEDHLMQYTGMRDKANVEIYEGDIIRHGGTGAIASVKWHGTMGGYIARQPTPEGKATGEWGELFRVFDHWKVIGNIYENPELLRGEQ